MDTTEPVTAADTEAATAADEEAAAAAEAIASLDKEDEDIDLLEDKSEEPTPVCARLYYPFHSNFHYKSSLVKRGCRMETVKEDTIYTRPASNPGTL